MPRLPDTLDEEQCEMGIDNYVCYTDVPNQ